MTPAAAAQQLLAAREGVSAASIVLQLAMEHPDLVARMTDDEQRDVAGWVAGTLLEGAAATTRAREALQAETNPVEESA